MKKASCIILIFCFMFFCGCKAEQKESTVVSASAAKSITVYITKTGECYHKSDCSCLNKSKIKKTLAQADKNYRACHLCCPPIIEE